MKKWLWLIGIIFITGCSSLRIPVKNDFWTKGNEKIGIVMSKKPVPGAYKVGSQGILDMAINSAMASTLEKHIATIKIDEFKEIKDIFKENLTKRGINDVVFLNDTISQQNVKDFRRYVGKKEYAKTLAKLKQNYNVDHLLVISIARYGTIRGYYGFIPLGAPDALFEVHGMLINLTTNEFEWYIEMSEEEASLKVVGNWDQEPDYPNLTKAILDAMRGSQSFLKEHFFSNNK